MAGPALLVPDFQALGNEKELYNGKMRVRELFVQSPTRHGFGSASRALPNPE